MNLVQHDAFIANGATSSQEMDLRGVRVVGIYLAAFTGTTIAFSSRPREVGVNGTGNVAKPVRDAAGAISLTVAANSIRALTTTERDELACLGLTTLTVTAAGADETVTLICEPRA